MNLKEIELHAANIHSLVQKSYPSLPSSDIAALCGYLASYLLAQAHPHQVFKMMGGMCYDILTYKEDSDVREEDQAISKEAETVDSSNGESDGGIPREQGD